MQAPSRGFQVRLLWGRILSFTRTDKGDHTWQYNVVAPGEDIEDGDSEGLESLVKNGELEFKDDGSLDTGASSGVDDDGIFNTDAITWANGAADSKIDIALDLSQYSGESSLVSKSQNGFASGTLEDVSVDEDGIITGAYSNGQSRDLAQVGLAKFANPNGLQQEGNNLFAETNASGQASVGTPGSGAGTIRSNSLEQSNVDIAEQFSDMITTQRAYQANSRSITTSDEMLQEVINIKR